MHEIVWVAAVLATASICWYFWPKLFYSSRLVSWVSVDYHEVLVSAGQWLIGLVSVVVIMRIFGFSAGEVLASLSAFALVAAVAFFAYWSVLSNGLCSLLLYLFQPFRIGDWIEMRENENNIVAAGKVVGINLIYVELVYVDDKGVENRYQIPTNLMFQRTIRVQSGVETQRLGRRHAGKQAQPETVPSAPEPASETKPKSRAKGRTTSASKPRPRSGKAARATGPAEKP